MLFLRFAILNLLLLFWNAAAALRGVARRKELPPILVWLGVGLLGIHLTTGAWLLGSLGVSPEKLFYRYFGLFVLSLAAAALQNLFVLQRLRWKSPGTYVLLGYNSLICGCTLLFWLNLRPGAVLPPYLQCIVRDYVHLQEVFMCFFAQFLPSFHLFPILALPRPGHGTKRKVRGGCLPRMGRLAARLPVVYAFLVPLVFLLSLGDSAEEIRLYAQDAPEPVATRADLRFGVKVQCDLDGPFEERLAWYVKELAQARELAVDCLMHYLPTDFMESEARIIEFETMVNRAREEGFVIMMAFPMAKDWFFRTADGITDDEYDRRVRSACLTAAERIHPRHLNPVVEPYGAQTLLGKRKRSPEEWAAFLGGIAKEVHAIDPDIRVGTNLCSITDADSESLFRLLCDPECPIDGPGLSINTGTGSLEETFATYSRWLEWVPPEKGCWVYEFAFTPLSFGQDAQARYIRRVADWAAREPRMAGISYYPLNDFSEILGLVAFGEHKRSGFTAYQQIIADTASKR